MHCHHVFTGFLLAISITLVTPALAQLAPPRPEVTGTNSVTLRITGWQHIGAFLGPIENRPGDARVARVDIGSGQVSSLQEALQAVLDTNATKLRRHTGFHEVKALPRIDSNRGWLIGGTAVRDGVPQRFMALVGRYGTSDRYYVSSFQAPEHIYKAWGGPAFFLRIAGKSVPEVLTPDLFAKLTTTTPEQDVRVGDMVITQSINVLFAQMSATMGNIAAMQRLGADIATRTDCVMTTGCVPGTDNQGRTIMTFPKD